MKNKKFEEFFRQYKNLVIKLVMSKINDYQVAQEICQQVFVSFYSHMDNISDDLVKAWLLQATRNAVIDYIRKNKGHSMIVLDEMAVKEFGNLLIEESLELYEDRKSKRDLVVRIMQEVRSVNEQWFEILVLSCVEGLSYAEIAKRMGVSEPMLRARMCRARAYIKKRFGEEYWNR
jgi:RNA polymerase sigma-70 factor (ECF subfamily)